MRKIFLFMVISLDGYYEGPGHDISWHHVDAEFNEFAISQLNEIGTLLFGRVTYQLMAGYWPTLAATRDDPIVAGLMNSLPKIVISKTLDKVEWNNSKLVRSNILQEITRMKQETGRDIAIFGSSDLSLDLARNGLIDEYRIMVNPVVLGNGKPVFKGMKDRLYLMLDKTKIFGNGNVLLYYKPGRNNSESGNV